MFTIYSKKNELVNITLFLYEIDSDCPEEKQVPYHIKSQKSVKFGLGNLIYWRGDMTETHEHIIYLMNYYSTDLQENIFSILFSKHHRTK